MTDYLRAPLDVGCFVCGHTNTVTTETDPYQVMTPDERAEIMREGIEAYRRAYKQSHGLDLPRFNESRIDEELERVCGPLSSAVDGLRFGDAIEIWDDGTVEWVRAVFIDADKVSRTVRFVALDNDGRVVHSGFVYNRSSSVRKARR